MTKMSKMTISIIIPTLNEEKTILKSLVSLFHQTLKPKEIILVDGGSNDSTISKVKGLDYLFPDFNIKIFQHYGEICPSSQNFGALVSKGDILLFLGSDVILEPKTLQRVQNSFNKNPNLIALTGLAIPFNSTSSCTFEYLAYYFTAKLFQSSKLRFIANNTFLAVKRKYFVDIGGFPLVENPDCLFASAIPANQTELNLGIKYYVNARRFNKMGFFGFNRYYNFCIGNFAPFMNKFLVLEKDSIQKVISRHS